MFLTDFINKEIFIGNNPRGVCVGLGISLKTSTVKYLLCASARSYSPHRPHADFAVGVNALESVREVIKLGKTRAIYPKSCARIFLNAPVYAEDGMFLGCLSDLELHALTACKIFTDKHETRNFNAVTAVSDAIILKKEAPFPIGQRIPAPVLSALELSHPLVSKTALKKAALKGELIRFTLALPPFSIYL